MRQAQPPRAEVLVLRAWVEGHRSPLRIRILQLTKGEESTSAVVHREEDVLAIVADWVDSWSAYGRARAERGVE